MTNISEMCPLYLVPLDGATLLDALTAGGESDTHVATDRPGERPTLLDDDMPVLEIVEDHVGWSLIAVGAILEDGAALREFVGSGDPAAAVSELEAASGAAMDMVEALGGLAACRVKGKWRPIDETERPLWSAHLADCNTVGMRAAAQAARAAANDDAPAAKAA